MNKRQIKLIANRIIADAIKARMDQDPLAGMYRAGGLSATDTDKLKKMLSEMESDFREKAGVAAEPERYVDIPTHLKENDHGF